MNTPVPPQDSAVRGARLPFRARRMRQLAWSVMGAFGLIGVSYLLQQNWWVAGLLLTGTAATAYSLHAQAEYESDRGFVIILWIIWATVSGLMWISNGLQDVALLAYPIILVVAGLLLGGRHFIYYLAAMLLFSAFLQYATSVLLWRSDVMNSTKLELLRDVWVVLLASAFAVWITVSDWRKLLGELHIRIDEYRQSQAHLTYLSQHDALTELPNRSLGRQLMEAAIVRAQTSGSHVALMFVDLDNFKFINDSVGHAAGDEFLQQIASRLRSAVRETDVVMRQSGDEFLVGLLDVPDIEAASKAANEVLEHLGGVYRVQGSELSSSCSIGLAVYPRDGHDFDTLLRHADLAMYQAKQAGRNTFRFFDVMMQDDLSANPRLVAELQTALVRGEFVLHYQPVVDMQDHRLLGVEALIRWQHPVRGLLGPVEFIPAAERSGLIVDIGRWVLEEACRQAVKWQRPGQPLVVAVNISPVQLHRGDLESAVRTALASSDLPGACLELEITESVLMGDATTLADTIRHLKALGVSIAVDDFGTGYSNLGYLQRFAADKIKIDQSFVRAMLAEPEQQAIVTAIIQMGKSLKLLPHAEGVESEDARALLLEMGCRTGQGYWFARPLAADMFATSFL